MHLRRRFIACGLLAAYAAQAAVVYKWTDADGLTHFSDQPMPGAVKIVTSAGSSNGIGGPTGAPVAANGQAPPKPAPVHSVLHIESPTADQAFFGDDLIPVRLQLEPELGPQQVLSWQLNGAPLSEQANVTSFTLQTLPRGAYQLVATVTDLAGADPPASSSVSFNVRQPSELAPLHKRP